VLATEELSEFGDHELGHTKFDEEGTCEMDRRNIDIWKNVTCLGLLKEDILPDTVDLEERKRARKKKPIIVGKNRAPTLRDCLCPNQKKLFYHVTLDIVRPLLETKSGNKYIL
jgi:hypothetical protein